MLAHLVLLGIRFRSVHHYHLHHWRLRQKDRLHVCQIHADLIHSVRYKMETSPALAYLITLDRHQPVDQNVFSAQNVLVNWLVLIKSAVTLVLDHVVPMLTAESLIIYQFVHVMMVSPEIHLRFVHQYQSLQQLLHQPIHATLHHVDQMQIARLGYVNVYQNIQEIRMKLVGQNVYLIQNVLVTELVSGINVVTLVLVHVVRMLSAMSSITYQYAPVLRAILEIHFLIAEFFLKLHQHQQIHVHHHLAVRTVNAAHLMVMQFVLVCLDLAVVHQVAGQNALSVPNALQLVLVLIKNVQILVLVLVDLMLNVKSSTIAQFAVAELDKREILSEVVMIFHQRQLHLQKHQKILVLLRHVDPIHSVSQQPQVHPLAHACLDILECHQIVDLNVLSTQIVQQLKLVSAINALTHALVLVVLMPNARS